MAATVSKTHCHHGHELTPANVYLNPQGFLVCRTCNREAGRKWAAANYQRLRADPIRVAKDREDSRVFRQRHPGKVREWSRIAYQRVRQEVLALYGGKCMRCGFADSRALQVDHVNGGGHKEHRSHGAMGVYKRAILLIGTGEYQLLCANCNWIKVHEQEEYPWAW